MLYDVAALSTSVALGPVAEAFGAHENTAFVITVPALFDALDPILNGVVPDAALDTTRPAPTAVGALASSLPGAGQPTIAIPDAPPLPFIGPEPADRPVERVQGVRLLEQLSLLSAPAIVEFVTLNPQAVDALLASPPLASEVSSWWTSLDVARRNAIRSASPQLIGNLDGVPYVVRDVANRAVLADTMSSLETLIDSDAGRTVIENARQQLRMLQSIDDSLGQGRSLMTLDVEGQGRAAIVLGDLRAADYVTYMVPGMFFTIENQMGDWVDAASRLHDEQLSWLAVLGGGASSASAAQSSATQSSAAQSSATQSSTAQVSAAQSSATQPSVATIAWIGYHTPNLTNVGGIDNAAEGRDSLARAIEGLQALRSGDEPYVTVVAHSYGSTAALMALTEYDFEIDALAMVGSPGSAAKSVDELHVRDGNVYVGEAAWDPIPNSSYFGSDPGAESYGAKPLGVDGGLDSLTKRVLSGSLGHNEYFSPGTESMRNFALIGIGQGRYVTSNGTTGGSAATTDLLPNSKRVGSGN